MLITWKINESWFSVFSRFSNMLHTLFLYISSTFESNTRLKLTKNQARAKQHPEAELLLFENYLLSSSMLSSKNNRTCSKKQVFLIVYFNEMIWLITIKVKKKIRSYRYDINRPTSSHALKYTNKYNKCLSMMMFICIRQHPTNTWGSFYEKVKEHWG